MKLTRDWRLSAFTSSVLQVEKLTQSGIAVALGDCSPALRAGILALRKVRDREERARMMKLSGASEAEIDAELGPVLGEGDDL